MSEPAAAVSDFSWERRELVPAVGLCGKSSESAAFWMRRSSRSATCRLMVAALIATSGMVGSSSSVSGSSTSSEGASAPSGADISVDGARHFAGHSWARHLAARHSPG